MSQKSGWLSNRKASIWILAIGIILGLLVVIIETQTVASFRKTTKVLVPKEDIQSYIQVSKDNFYVKEWPQEYVPTDAITSLNEVDGKWTKGTLIKGMPFTKRNIGDTSGNLTASLLQKGAKGFRYVPVPADALTSFGDKLIAGDFVNVIGWTKDASGVNIAKTLPNNALVEEIISDSSKKTIGVTLYTSTEQANEIEKMMVNGKIRFWITTPKNE